MRAVACGMAWVADAWCLGRLCQSAHAGGHGAHRDHLDSNGLRVSHLEHVGYFLHASL